MYPDGHTREALFRDSGDMLQPAKPEAVGLFGRLVAAFSHWRMKRTGRLALRDLDDSQLRDIGVTRDQVKDELSKSYFPFG